MISFRQVGFRYSDQNPMVLADVDLDIDEGELTLVAGSTGSGKSTLLGMINGLVPHFTGGVLSGDVIVGGRSTADHRPRDFAGLVGVVGQDPLAGFVTDTVEDELAYGMEQLGVPPAAMRKRVEETLDLLGIADLRDRALRLLSGGQQQRVAIAAVLAAGPRVLVLDEPTSALDPTSAEEVLSAVTRLVHDLGITAVIAEHRMERVVQYADRLVLIDAGAAVRSGDPRDLLPGTDIAPPVVELSRLLGWEPTALSVREARRSVSQLRNRLGIAPNTPERSFPPGLDARGVTVRYGDLVAVDDLSITLGSGEVVALMGRNGSGKSSLLWALTEHGRRDAGTVRPAGGGSGRSAVALVPQSPADLLYLDSVAGECAAADDANAVAAGSCLALLEALVPGVDTGAQPRDLSEGQRLALALTIQLLGSEADRDRSVVLLDEPTRGLDHPSKRRLAALLKTLAGRGAAVLIATHDVEFAAIVANRVVVLAQGEIVADGSTVDVLTANPAFAPQMAKVMYPDRWLTVDQVRSALVGVR